MYFSHSPVHDCPSPVYPELQVHVNDPIVLVQAALLSQSSSPDVHSLASTAITKSALLSNEELCTKWHHIDTCNNHWYHISFPSIILCYNLCFRIATMIHLVIGTGLYKDLPFLTHSEWDPSHSPPKCMTRVWDFCPIFKKLLPLLH